MPRAVRDNESPHSGELSDLLTALQACGPDDDWSGVKERAERRKIQNRLNVRAHRKWAAGDTGLGNVSRQFGGLTKGF
jgi:hypothetical protein